MLEQLFGSRTRIKLLKIFLAQPYERFFIRELTRKIGERINSVRREIANLERLGVVVQERAVEASQPGGRSDGVGSRRGKRGLVRGRIKKTNVVVDKRKFYCANPAFVLFDELKSLILKSQLLAGRSLTEAMNTLGKVKLMLLTGFFVGDASADTDLLVVGSVNRKHLMRLVRQLEKSFGHQVNYTFMSAHEFKLRRAMTDKFLYKILEGKRMTLVNEID